MIELSPSSLSKWKTCQRLWALNKLYDVDEPPSIWTAIGSSLHETIGLIGSDDRPPESILRERLKKNMKGVKTNGLPIGRVKEGLVLALNQIDWLKFKRERNTKHEVYFLKEFDGFKFRGFVDCLTDDGTVYEWKTTSRKDIPVPEHVEQGSLYREMLDAQQAFVMYFLWRSGQVRAFKITPMPSHIPEIRKVAEEIETHMKKGIFLKTGNCKDCFVRKECQSRSW